MLNLLTKSILPFPDDFLISYKVRNDVSYELEILTMGKQLLLNKVECNIGSVEAGLRWFVADAELVNRISAGRRVTLLGNTPWLHPVR